MSNDRMNTLVDHLHNNDLQIERIQGNRISLIKGYDLELESNALVKLLHDGQVIAPFSSISELIAFIKMDIQLNEES